MLNAFRQWLLMLFRIEMSGGFFSFFLSFFFLFAANLIPDSAFRILHSVSVALGNGRSFVINWGRSFQPSKGQNIYSF